MPGRDPRALLLDGRIHSGGNLLAGLVPLRTGGGETDGRPFPEVKRLLLAQETVVHAPEFGAVGLVRAIEAKGIVKIRSEERRVGTECVRPCSSRGARYH